MEVSNEFKVQLTEWVNIKKTLAKARGDIKVLNTREKELRPKVADNMVNQEIDNVNLSKGEKVSVKKRVSKGSTTRDVITKGLMEVFNDNEVEVERVMSIIDSHRPTKETTSLLLTGIKKNT